MQKDLFKRQVELVKESLVTLSDFGKILVNANLAIRKELEMPLNEKEYRELRQREDEMMKANMQGFIIRIQKFIEDIYKIPIPKSEGK